MKAPVEVLVEAMVGAEAWCLLSPTLRRLWLESAAAGMAAFADPPEDTLSMVGTAMFSEYTRQQAAEGRVTWNDLARAALLILTMPPLEPAPSES